MQTGDDLSQRGWWGEPWPSADRRAPVCEDDAERLPYHPAEAGASCELCEYKIEPTDSGSTIVTWRAGPGAGTSVVGFVHKECSLRSVTGNEVHVRGLCSYRGECTTLSKLDYRQQGLEVWKYVVEQGHEPAF